MADIKDLYIMIENRDGNEEQFMEFLRFMISQREPTFNSLDSKTQDDFLYHSDKIPEYTEQRMKRTKDSVRRKLAGIEMAIKQLYGIEF